MVAIRWPMVANAGDMDPLQVEPGVQVRWVRSPAALGQPDLVVLPGSKATRSDLDWFRATGLAAAVQAMEVPVVGICAGLQMCGISIDDPDGVEGPPGNAPGLGWLPVTTTFEVDKVLDRPTGTVTDCPGQDERIVGYRIHHGRVRPLPGEGLAAAINQDHGVAAAPDARARVPATTWLTGDDGAPLGWHNVSQHRAIPAEWATPDGLPNVPPAPELLAAPEPAVFGTTVHAVFEDDGFRAAFLAWVAQQGGKAWTPRGVSFEAIRQDRLDRIADTLETHLDLDRLSEIVTLGAPDWVTTGDRPKRRATSTKRPGEPLGPASRVQENHASNAQEPAIGGGTTSQVTGPAPFSAGGTSQMTSAEDRARANQAGFNHTESIAT